MEKLKAAWHRISDSLWFIPTLLTLTGGIAAVLLMKYNDALLGDVDVRELWWIFGGGSDGAQSVLQVISGSLITVTGVIFSITMIVLQLASSQFTPRVLRQFMADRSNQFVLGVFIGTFTYTLLVLRSVRGDSAGEAWVPQVAVTGAVVLALVSIGFLIYFINHIARSVQAAVVINSIAQDTLRVVREVYPRRLDPGELPPEPDSEVEVSGDPPARALKRPNVFAINSAKTGYLQGVDYERMCEVAAENGWMVNVEVEIGSWLLAGQRIMVVSGPDRLADDIVQKLQKALVVGSERTPHQDLKYGVLELMDIAVKAMSPSINDPTTAVNSIHRLSEVLLELAWRADGDRLLRDDSGMLRVSGRRPTLEDTIGLAFNQIRHYAADNATVVIVILDSLGELAALAPEHAKSAFIAQLHAVNETARRRISDNNDRARVEEAVAHALSRAAAPSFTDRVMTAPPG